MRKLFALLLAVCMLLCLCACGDTADKPVEDTTQTTGGSTTVGGSDITDSTTAGDSAPTTTVNQFLFDEDENVFNDAELSWD